MARRFPLSLSWMVSRSCATAAQRFGQEDDISVISVTRTAKLKFALAQANRAAVPSVSHARKTVYSSPTRSYAFPK